MARPLEGNIGKYTYTVMQQLDEDVEGGYHDHSMASVISVGSRVTPGFDDP